MFRLKELRQEYGMTRAQLSRAVSINQGTLANYENGIREADYKTLSLLARFFDVNIEYLIGYEDYPDKNIVPQFKPLTIKEKILISTYRSLSEKSRDYLDDTVALLDELEQKKEV